MLRNAETAAALPAVATSSEEAGDGEPLGDPELNDWQRQTD